MTDFPALDDARALFDLPRDLAYLNAAYMGPMPLAARLAGEASYDRRSRPWEYDIGEDFFARPERVRALAARIFRARTNDIALVPAASYGLATAAANLTVESGGEILMLDGQFPSNVYAWRRMAERDGATLRTIARRDGQSWSDAIAAAIGPRTGLLACPHVHWIDGGRVDLPALRPALREAGAALVLDLTQSLGALEFDAQAVDPDFAVAAGYKWLLGPYQSGLLYVAPRHQSGRPLEENWIAREGSQDFANLTNYQDGYAPGAARFDAGERSGFQTLPALEASLSLIVHYGPDAISRRAGALTAALAQAAAPLGLRADVPGRAPHYLSLALPDGAPGDLPARLKADGVLVSQRDRSLRVSPHLYNDEADVARFGAAVRRALG